MYLFLHVAHLARHNNIIMIIMMMMIIIIIIIIIIIKLINNRNRIKLKTGSTGRHLSFCLKHEYLSYLRYMTMCHYFEEHKLSLIY